MFSGTSFFLKKSAANVWWNQKKAVPLHRNSEMIAQARVMKRIAQGRLAQLVQSICLTSRGSAVRIRQRPRYGMAP